MEKPSRHAEVLQIPRNAVWWSLRLGRGSIFRHSSRRGNNGVMFCASVAYPVDAEAFDFDYFRQQHAPMFANLLGENCVRYEVHRALASPGAPPPPFVAAAYFWVTSAEAFGQTLADHGSVLYADIANFSQTQPVRGWAEVTAADQVN